MAPVTLTAFQTAWNAAAAPYVAEMLAAGLSAIPPVFRDDARTLEDIKMLAQQAAVAKAVGVSMLLRIGVSTASVDTGWTDPTGAPITGPDWLNFLAGDYGTSRVGGETDAVCRNRMRSVPLGVIRSELLFLAQAIVDAAGVVGTVAMDEMPRDSAYFGEWTSDTGTGGTFASGSFTPTVRFASGHPPFWSGESGRTGDSYVTFTGSTNPGNDGTFQITRLTTTSYHPSAGNTSGDAVCFAGGLAGGDPTVTWTITRFSKGRYPYAPMTGGRAFFSRGHRMWRGQPANGTGTGKGIAGIIMILPYGCTDSTKASVVEMLRQRAAGGVIKRVEVRAIP